MQTAPVIQTQISTKPAPSAAAKVDDNARTAGDFEQALEQEAQRSEEPRQAKQEAAKVAAAKESDEQAKQASALEAQDATEKRRDSDAAEDKDNSDWHGFLESVYDRIQSLRDTSDNEAGNEKSRILKLDELPLFHGGPVGDESARVVKFAVDKEADSEGLKVLPAEDDGITESKAKELKDSEARVSDEQKLNTLQDLLSSVESALEPEEAEALSELLPKLASGEKLSKEESAFLTDLFAKFEQLTQDLLQNKVTLDTELTSEQEQLMTDLRALVAQVDATQSESFSEELREGLASLSERLTQLESLLEANTNTDQEFTRALSAFANGDSKPLEAWLAKQSLTEAERQQFSQELAQFINSLTATQRAQLSAEFEKATTIPQVAMQAGLSSATEKESPVAKSFQRAAEQFRDMISTLSEAQQGEDNADEFSDEQRNGMARISELLAQLGSAQSSTNTPLNPVANGVQSNTATNFQAQLGTAATVTSQQQAPAQTAVEQARQVQQHIDLFGPQAPTQLREQVMVMVNSRQQYAEMRLDPPELGKLQIRIQVNNENQASVQFSVNSPQAREAIEQALPKLRDMLEQQGLQLADTDVKEERQEQYAGQTERRGNGGNGSADAEETAETESDTVLRPQIVDAELGRVDFYA